MQSLLNLRSHLQATPLSERPFVVAEVLDADKEQAAAHAYGGPIEVVQGDAVIARLLAQAALDPRLAAVFLELLTHNEGCSPFVRAWPEFVGQHPLALGTHLDRRGGDRCIAATSLASLSRTSTHRRIFGWPKETGSCTSLHLR